MLAAKFDAFRHHVSQQFSRLPRRKLSTEEWDSFMAGILADTTLDTPDRLYARDGFAHVHEIDRDTFQIAAFQINAFGPGVFGDAIVRFNTPVLLTVQAGSRHRHATRTLDETPLVVTEFALGKSYCGSKGDLCQRDSFERHARAVLQVGSEHHVFGHRMMYQIINANFICHHIAEALSYAFGALHLHWTRNASAAALCSASHFNESREMLFIETVDDFGAEAMRCHFEVPHYTTLMADPQKFREQFDNLLAEITWRGEIESFYLPVGYQKVSARRHRANVNIITTQHILQHLLRDYYQRPNAFVVAGTFQTLELLSRGFLRRAEGHPDECAAFVRNVTTCLGYYPERDVEKFFRDKEAGYNSFETEFTHTMFFRPPVLM